MYQPSFWERESVFSDIDVCIIGSGIVGLNAAIHMKSMAPQLNVVIIDSGFLPYGASTRNAGFACFGSMTELLDDLEKEDEKEVFKRVELRWKGLLKLRRMLGDAEIDYEPLGGFELFTERDEVTYQKCLSKIDDFNKLLHSITGKENIYAIADGEINRMGFRSVSHLILNSGEGQIDTGKMMNVLEKKARQTGIRIINGLSIRAIKSDGNGVELNADDNYNFKTRRCLVANNGFAAGLLPELDVKPARAQVLITKPVADLPFRGSFHYEKGFYYFRNVGDRVLFGGGRNLDFAGETTTEFGLTGVIQDRLEDLLKNVILPQRSYEIDMRWSGIMGLGNSKTTILKETGENIYCAVRMGGMGVAIGSVIGEQAAEMVVASL